MNLVSTQARELFAALGRVPLRSDLKKSEHENLTDRLEVIAVFLGLKPAHLDGQGFVDPVAQKLIEAVAMGAGLISQRTRNLQAYRHRLAKGPSEYVDFFTAYTDSREVDREPLWIFREPEMKNLINSVIDGSRTPAPVLGYPECCILHRSETSVLLLEEGIEQLGSQAHDLADFQRLVETDQQFQISPSLARRMEFSSLDVFPYVQFSACPQCVAEPSTSPAGELNSMMRTLAYDLDSSFAKKFEMSARSEGGFARPGSAMLDKAGRNAPCPCSSGKKYKKCHGAR